MGNHSEGNGGLGAVQPDALSASAPEPRRVTNYWLLLGWLDNYGVRLSDVGVVNLLGFQLQVSLQHKIHGRTARQLRFRTAREQHRRQARESADPSTNACSLASACDCADARAGHRRGRDCFRVLALAAGAGDFSFGVRTVFAGIRAARLGIQIHGVAVWKNQGVQPYPPFALPLHPPWPLRASTF